MQHQLLFSQQQLAQPAAGRGSSTKRPLARPLRAPAHRRFLCVGQSAGAAGTRTAVSVIDERVLQQPNRRPSTPQLRLVARVCYLPHPAKESYGGEDAHFISESAGAMGVADGVGGWAESGINPAEYSRTLMAVARAHLEGRDLLQVIPERTQGSIAVREFMRNPVPPPLPGMVDPQAAVDVAHRLTRLPGSSTVCLLQLDPYSESLVAANVGDSGFMLVRDGQKALQSRPLEHFFDCPLQLGAFPDYVQATDSAADAELYEIPLQHGDVIIVGTDGLWDNCYDKELLRLIPRSADEVQAAADAMAALARRHASDPDYASPYIQEARQNGFDLPWWEKVLGAKLEGGLIKLKDPTGGKQDDITVIVAYVDYLDGALDDVSGSAATTASSNDTASSNGVTASSNGSSNGVGVAVVVEEVEEAEAAAASGNGVNGVVVEDAAVAVTVNEAQVEAAATVEEAQAEAAAAVEEAQVEAAATVEAAQVEAAATVEEAATAEASVTVEEEVTAEAAVAAEEEVTAEAAVAAEEEATAEAVVAAEEEAAAEAAPEVAAAAAAEEEAAPVVAAVVVDEAAAAQLVEVGQAAAGGAAAGLVAEVKVAGAVAAQLVEVKVAGAAAAQLVEVGQAAAEGAAAGLVAEVKVEGAVAAQLVEVGQAAAGGAAAGLIAEVKGAGAVAAQLVDVGQAAAGGAAAGLVAEVEVAGAAAAQLVEVGQAAAGGAAAGLVAEVKVTGAVAAATAAVAAAEELVSGPDTQ